MGANGSLPMVSLDYLDEFYVKKGSYLLVVIDTEGYEESVMLGAKQLINSRKVPIYQIEVWWQSTKDIPRKLGLRHLESVGYHFFLLAKSREFTVAEIEAKPIEIDINLADFIAVRKIFLDRYLNEVASK
jgi:hypothetical protein